MGQSCPTSCFSGCRKKLPPSPSSSPRCTSPLITQWNRWGAGESLMSPRLVPGEDLVLPRPTEPIEAKICIAGDPQVGKTSLFHQLLEGEFVDSPRHRQLTLEDINCTADLWDLPPHGCVESVPSVHFRNSAVCLLVYDHTLSSAEALLEWITDVLRFCPSTCELILVGNTKIGDEWTDPHIKTIIKDLTKTRDYKNFIVNTKSGIGIPELSRHIKICLVNFHQTLRDNSDQGSEVISL
ncbi:hypothetical protein Pelo_6956 [Pelomyxa schiedti]|nr:hypothetical protein Pelo_6956 [Pelomyxa schiedti]